MLPFFEATVKGITVIPYVRMTNRGKWKNPRALAYLKNQENMAWEFKEFYQGIPITSPCVLSYVVQLPHNRRVDDDNIRKALQDALQYAKIISNDYLIKGSDYCRTIQGNVEPLVWVRLDEYHLKDK